MNFAPLWYPLAPRPIHSFRNQDKTNVGNMGKIPTIYYMLDIDPSLSPLKEKSTG
jgi:hypothetical protein